MLRRSWGLACTLAAIVVPLPALGQQPAPAPKPEALSALWQDLVDLDGEKAFRAMRRLAALPETIRFLRATVPAAAKTATSKQIEDLIRQLDSERFAERDKARQELERLDWQAVTALRHAARGGSLELKRRVEQLIARTEGLLTGENLRWHRTVEIVEWIGTAAAKALLERWSQGAREGRLTQEANKALKRWGPRMESPPLAKRATVDGQGDSLPAGAILRLGSIRWRMEAGGFGWGSLQYSPNGKRLVVVAGHVLGVVNAGDGRILARLESDRYGGWSAESGLLTPDGKRLVASGYSYGNQMRFDTLRVLDLNDLKEIKEWPVEGTVAGFAEKSNTVLLGTPKGIRQFDLEAGREVGFLPLPKAAQGPVLAFHGKTAVVGSAKRTQLLVYDVTAPEKTISLEVPDRLPTSFAFSPDGKILACGVYYDWGLLLFDLESGQPIRHIVSKDNSRNPVNSLAFSADGKTLVFNAYSSNKGELVAWDMDRHKPRWKKKGFGSGLVFSPDGRFIAGKGGSRISVWEAATGKEITGRDEPAAASTQELAFADDGKSLLTVQANAVRLWDFPAGKGLKEFSHPQVHSAALSSNGRRLATSSFNHGLRVWDTGTGRELMKLPDRGSQTGYARDFVFTQDSRRLCTWEADYRLRVWDIETGRLIAEHLPRPEGFPKVLDDDDNFRHRRRFEKELDFRSNFGFSSDGSRFLFHFNKLRIYDTATGKEVQTFAEETDSGYYRRLQTSKDQEWLLMGGGSDRPRTLFNLRLGRKFGQLEFGGGTHSGASAMCPDGRCFALDISSGTKRKIVLYETATLRPRLALPLAYGYAYRLAFSPEGRFLAAAHIDGTVLVWDVRGLEAEN